MSLSPIPSPSPPTSRAQRRAVAIAVACAIGMGVITAMVSRATTEGPDRAGLLLWRCGPALSPCGPPWLLEAVRDVTALGGVLLRNLFAIGVVIALSFIARRRQAVLYGSAVVSGWLVDAAIKHLVDRPRPVVVPHLTQAGGTSFPSGHSFNAAVVYVTAASIFAAMAPRRAARATILGAAVVIVIAIGLSRVWLGVHNPSDVIAGWLGGFCWANLCVAIARAEDRSRPPGISPE